MLVILSPSKTLDFNRIRNDVSSTLPLYLEEASLVAAELRRYNPKQLARFLNVSPKLADLNANRYSVWNTDAHSTEGKPAVLSYKGDVYQGLQAENFSDSELEFAQKHLRIISGLYGVLRPLDRILPYRIEMATPLKVGKSKNLYAFWTSKVTAHLEHVINETNAKTLVNLASEEYSKVVDSKESEVQIITPVFKDFKNGQYKVISFFAKKARGLMSGYIIRNGITNPEKLKLFSDDGYYFNDGLTKGNTWVFTRN
ncbi:MAG: peroxide stress protein YaaA [Bacteroidales bacterium]|nr:peroxide stress protein YaaA [Bacteroidales bacterium]